MDHMATTVPYTEGDLVAGSLGINLFSAIAARPRKNRFSITTGQKTRASPKTGGYIFTIRPIKETCHARK
jgi:hypothetical protein